MSTPFPPPGEQPAYVDPVTGQRLYVDPVTGQLAYTDPTSASPTVPYPAAGYTPPGYSPGSSPQVSYPTSPSLPQSGYTAPGFPGYPPYPESRGRTNPLAITSMVLSICSLVFLVCYGIGGLVLGLAGAIIGHVGRRQIRDRGEEGAGMATAGIIMGWISTVIGLLIIALLITVFGWLVHEGQQDPTEFG